jgi:putative FmdB family regulatory protein
MPLYEYECGACGHRFEIIQRFSDPPLDTCPKCGRTLRKLQSAPAFQFKGSGWYVTDYARKDSAAEAQGEGESKDSTPSGKDGTAPSGKDATASSGKDTTASGGKDTTASGGKDTTASGGKDTTASGGKDSASKADSSSPSTGSTASSEPSKSSAPRRSTKNS